MRWWENVCGCFSSGCVQRPSGSETASGCLSFPARGPNPYQNPPSRPETKFAQKQKQHPPGSFPWPQPFTAVDKFDQPRPAALTPSSLKAVRVEEVSSNEIQGFVTAAYSCSSSPLGPSPAVPVIPTLPIAVPACIRPCSQPRTGAAVAASSMGLASSPTDMARYHIVGSSSGTQRHSLQLLNVPAMAAATDAEVGSPYAQSFTIPLEGMADAAAAAVATVARVTPMLVRSFAGQQVGPVSIPYYTAFLGLKKGIGHAVFQI